MESLNCRRNQLDENGSNNLRAQLGECFDLMRFRAMEYEEIDKILSNKLYEIFINKDELDEIIQLNLK